MRYRLTDYAGQVALMDPDKTYSVLQATDFIHEHIPPAEVEAEQKRHLLETVLFTSFYFHFPRRFLLSHGIKEGETADGVDLGSTEKPHPAWFGSRWVNALKKLGGLTTEQSAFQGRQNERHR